MGKRTTVLTNQSPVQLRSYVPCGKDAKIQLKKQSPAAVGRIQAVHVGLNPALDSNISALLCLQIL